jgi:uncharacterized membrane protein YgcG
MKSRGNTRVKQLISRGSLLAPATAIFVYVLETSSAVAQQSLPYYGPHPWWGSGWMFFGPFMMIICFAAVVVFAVLLIRWFGDRVKVSIGCPQARHRSISSGSASHAGRSRRRNSMSGGASWVREERCYASQGRLKTQET